LWFGFYAHTVGEGGAPLTWKFDDLSSIFHPSHRLENTPENYAGSKRQE
jgi:hypothetical protein